MKTIDNQQLQNAFSQLSTPLIADAIVRLGINPRIAPPGIQPLIPGTKLAGYALPVRHYGSVDVFFEAMTSAQAGDIMVIDNQGRSDEGCIGDLTALEAQAFSIAGIIVWGHHRDTKELIEMEYPVFSYGSNAFGPLNVDKQEIKPLTTAQFGSLEVKLGDIVFADEDGVLFVSNQEIERLLNTAHEIQATERRQAEAITNGLTMHEQLKFDEYLEKRKIDSAYSFRKHLRSIGGAIEE